MIANYDFSKLRLSCSDYIEYCSRTDRKKCLYVLVVLCVYAKLLRTLPQVLQVSEDRKVKTLTTHSYNYLGLPQGPWVALGGVEKAGEGVVIGVIDSGIFPDHPSFYSNTTTPYLAKPNGFNGSCDVSSYFPIGSCNGKLLAAQHFFQTAMLFHGINATSPGRDYGSPFGLAGHGT